MAPTVMVSILWSFRPVVHVVVRLRISRRNTKRPRRVKVVCSAPRDPYLGVTTSRTSLLRPLERPAIVADQVEPGLRRGTDRRGLTRAESRLRPRGLVDVADLPLNACDGREGDDAGARDERGLVGRDGQIDVDLAAGEQGDDLVRGGQPGLVGGRPEED